MHPLVIGLKIKFNNKEMDGKIQQKYREHEK